MELNSKSSIKIKNKMKTTKKRKERNPNEEEEKEAKKSASKNDTPENKSEDNPPWTNLQLILSLENKKLDNLIKLELAFSYVQSKIGKEEGDSSHDSEMLSNSRVVVFLNNWVQGALIASWKNIMEKGNGQQVDIYGSCFDCRCWVIFKFCLEGYKELHASLSFPRHLLEVFHYVVKDELCRLNGESRHVKEPPMSDKEMGDLLQIVTDCVSLVFSSHGNFTNANIALWVSVVSTVLKLIQKVFLVELYCSDTGASLLQLSYYLLEPFAKFLRVHPAKNKDFCYFIDELLEPLLHLLDVSCSSIDIMNSGVRKNVHKMIEEVFFQGIFHPSQIDGFLSLRCTMKYKTAGDTKVEGGLVDLKSYHKHLFEKFRKIISAKNKMALGGVGEMFHSLVNCIRRQKTVIMSREDSRVMDLGSVPHPGKNISSNNKILVKSSGLNPETRLSIFDFFVQIMQFFISEVDFYVEADLSEEPILEDIFCIFRSINVLLSSFVNEKIYTKTEDISEGACLIFLKMIYDKIMLFSDKFYQFWMLNCSSDEKGLLDVLSLIAKEIIVSVRHLLDIEYDVAGDDLESLWGILLSYTACGNLLIDLPTQSLLTHEILQLGCKIIDLYHELRQVNTSIAALCKALRLLTSPQQITEVRILPQYHGSFANSLTRFLCSVDFRRSVCNAIKSIPEGQSSGCIQQLTADVSETLDQLKVYDPSASEDGCVDPRLTLQIELMGRGLSELYTLILDSMIVTPGNSSLVGRSMQDLMEVLRPLFSVLVSPPLDNNNQFLSGITGIDFKYQAENLNTHWIVTFFFRLYLSSRSLFLQVISVMPPDASKKMLIEMGDMLTSYSGMDWVQKTSLTREGYFCWVGHPSDSLPNVLHTMSDLYLQDKVRDCSSLVYVLSAMILQRLVDLSRLIKSIEYLIQRNDYLIKSKLVDDASLSRCCKRNRKWGIFLTNMRQEAACLTETLVKYLWSLPEDQFGMQEHTWDFSIGTVDKESLPTALWCIICHNVDIWCIHASKKDLRNFLSHLIKSSAPCDSTNGSKNNEAKELSRKKVTVHDISLSLLSDVNLYEQKFVRRHMTSIFQRILENSVSSIFSCDGEVNLNSEPDWEEAIHILKNLSTVSLADRHWEKKHSLLLEGTSHFFGPLSAETYQKEQLHPQRCSEFHICQSLLGFLARMPKGHLSLKSFRHYAYCILNLERITVNNLLGSGHHDLSNEQLVLLFLACRKTLKNFVSASCEAKMEGGKSSLCSILMEDPANVLWLWKSLSTVIELHHSFPEDTIARVKDLVFPMMDQTSSLFFYLGKNQFEYAIYSPISACDTDGQKSSNVIDQEETGDSFCSQLVNCLNGHNAWENVIHLVEFMREHMHNSLSSIGKASLSTKSSFLSDIKELKRLSCVMSCCQGVLWGLASTLDKLDAMDDRSGKRFPGCSVDFVRALFVCIDTCTQFVNYFIRTLLFEDGDLPQSLSSAVSHISGFNDVLTETREASPDNCTDNDGLVENAKRTCESSALSLCSRKVKTVQNEEFEGMLIKMEGEQKYLRKSLLQGLVRGDNIELAIFLRQLFIASSASLRLNFQLNRISSSWSLTTSLISISELLLLEFAKDVTLPESASFLWLNGVVKFLEQLGSYLPLVDYSLSQGLYAKLIDLHLLALGRCISLQGKRATLASQESESSTKMLNCQGIYSTHTTDKKSYGLNEFKDNLRKSFVVFIKESSKLHLASAVESVERAMVGTCHGCILNSEIRTGGLDGGTVSMSVASGIYCLDLILEYVTGRKHLNLVKIHIQNFVASLFNVLLHLHGPNIFYQKVHSDPDPGSVVLMCINVLARVFGKPSLFQMDACHVAQSLRIPASLLQILSCIRTQEAPDRPLTSSTGDVEDPLSAKGFVLDRHFTIELYAACCQLLCTLLKHHKSETQRCFSLLQDSVGVLLCCLEMVGTVPISRKHSFAWELQEGVKCATFLRRVYEEMRQQKDVFGNNCFQLLFSYIWVYCGFGPLKIGITREIDEALRPGIYALIDACSSDDLQRLHTDFGEGPCRSTLANLQHDYKIYFQYEGKV